MKKSIWVRALCAIVMSVVLGWTPDPVFAQRGGGFHGGGGFYGGYRGGASYGWRGGYYPGWGGSYYRYPGYYGWRGGYWGYPGFGYGWGISLGFGWGWPAYPYAYGYSPWWGSPYYYPYYYPYYGSYYVPSNDPAPYAYPNNVTGYDSRTAYPTEHSSAPAPPIAPNHNSVSIGIASFKPADPNYPMTDQAAGHYRPPNSIQQPPTSRPAVQNVIRALHAMPPDAAQRQIDSGRYSSFSPEERQLLYNAVLPPAWEKPSQSVPHPLLYARAGE